MKKNILFFLLFLFTTISRGQHTFSIVAIDPETGEIGSAGATCIADEFGALDISDIILGTGAIHTQAFFTSQAQDIARARMEAGDSPQEIIDFLIANDPDGFPEFRQYGIVDLNDGTPRTAAYSGAEIPDEFSQIIGPNYVIVGNILISQEVFTDMETAFLNTEGTLAEKLMASLQGAKRPGTDIRCLDDGISSSSAFIRVADPSDTDTSFGNLSLDLNVFITDEIFEPIDELQILFDQTLSTEDPTEVSGISVYPNPSNGELFVKSVVNVKDAIVYNAIGQKITRFPITNNLTSLDLSNFENGVYFLSLLDNNSDVFLKYN